MFHRSLIWPLMTTSKLSHTLLLMIYLQIGKKLLKHQRSKDDYDLAKLWLNNKNVNDHLPNQEGENGSALKQSPNSEGVEVNTEMNVVSLEGDPKHTSIIL